MPDTPNAPEAAPSPVPPPEERIVPSKTNYKLFVPLALIAMLVIGVGSCSEKGSQPLTYRMELQPGDRFLYSAADSQAVDTQVIHFRGHEIVNRYDDSIWVYPTRLAVSEKAFKIKVHPGDTTVVDSVDRTGSDGIYRMSRHGRPLGWTMDLLRFGRPLDRGSAEHAVFCRIRILSESVRHFKSFFIAMAASLLLLYGTSWLRRLADLPGPGGAPIPVTHGTFNPTTLAASAGYIAGDLLLLLPNHVARFLVHPDASTWVNELLILSGALLALSMLLTVLRVVVRAPDRDRIGMRLFLHALTNVAVFLCWLFVAALALWTVVVAILLFVLFTFLTQMVDDAARGPGKVVCPVCNCTGGTHTSWCRNNH